MIKKKTAETLLEFDRQHIWHPYTSLNKPLPTYFVESAHGCKLRFSDQREVVDGMSSWWAAVHGYNHPRLNQAAESQLKKMAHVMFGGITHEPAIALCQQLVAMTPEGLDAVFLADSGSISVEVAIKMAIQYQHSRGKHEKSRLLTIKRGYHGDTFAAMSVCDPINGMHKLFRGILPRHLFVEAPTIKPDESWQDAQMDELRNTLRAHHQEIAAIILEPVVQGAGGMRFYHPEFVKAARMLADEFDVLLIADEIATGFGRTGRLFACDHANITPDILCVGKALSGGYVTLAATITTREIAHVIGESKAGALMHGPTFMGNPLACAIACESLKLIQENHWQIQVPKISQQLKSELMPLRDYPEVADVRVFGAIGVVEMKRAVNVAKAQAKFVALGAWIRPFGKLIYVMPPYIIQPKELQILTDAIETVCKSAESYLFP